ncbi:MAG: hypothetical protein HOV66_22260, partial [Streptomycetaceae bacterium]|nr:hypothetical protein [Streptomycetaceae bacterium]
MSVFIGGATAGKAAVARAQSRVTVLAILDQLMKRTHLMPSLSEAFDEAFTTFAVRLAMIAFGPDGRRPHGFDWNQIVQDAVFGGVTGMFHGAFEGVVDRFKNLFRRGHLDDTLFKKFDEDVLPKVDRDRGADLPSPNRDGTNRDGSDRNGPDPAGTQRDGFGDDIGDAVVEGAAETAGEFVTVGLFTGSWALSGDTFLTAAGSALFMGAVFAGVAKFGSQFNVHMDVAGAVNDVRALDADPVGTRSTKGSDEETPVTDVLSESEGSGQEGRTNTPAAVSPGAPGTSSMSGMPGTSHPSRTTPTTSRDDDTDTEGAGTGGSEESAPTPRRTVSGTPEAEASVPKNPTRAGASDSDDLAPPAPVPTASGTPVTATASPAPAHSTTTSVPPASAPGPATPVTPSAVASQPRTVARTIPFPGHDEDLRVLDVVGDGDCFFTSLLAGLHHQGHGSALTAMDVPRLRQHAANRFHGSERYRELNEQGALDVLVQDLDTDTLSAVLGTPLPSLSHEQNETVDNQLRDNLYGMELRRRVDPADRAVLADLNQATIRALLPGYQPDVRRVPRAERERLAARLQATALRARLREALTGGDPVRAEQLWTRLLDTRYPRWAQQGPRLADFRDRRLGDLVTDSIRSTDLWATPFFDHAPSEVAHALDLNVTVVQHRDGGTLDAALNSAAGRPVYLHYNGTAHYAAIENSPSPEDRPEA